MFSTQRCQPDPGKVQAVKELPIPKDRKVLQHFLGMANYLSSYFPHLADMAVALRKLLVEDAEWAWQSSQAMALKAIQDSIAKQTTQKYYDSKKPAVVQCDASDYGLGAALFLGSPPVTFASRTLTDAEQRYAQIEKECLAIVFACVLKFEYYLSGRENVHIQTDHEPLEAIFLKGLMAAPKRLQRMLLRLQWFNLTVQYQPGREMHLADCLLRAPLHKDSRCKSSQAGNTDEIYEELQMILTKRISWMSQKHH